MQLQHVCDKSAGYEPGAKENCRECNPGDPPFYLEGACPACVRRGKKTWTGANPRCAFSQEGAFSTSNWNCETMNALRGTAHAQGNVSEWYCDYYFGTVTWGDKIVIMSWYKSRGSIDRAYVYDRNEDYPAGMAPPHVLDLETAETIITQPAPQEDDVL